MVVPENSLDRNVLCEREKVIANVVEIEDAAIPPEVLRVIEVMAFVLRYGDRDAALNRE